MQMDGKLGRSPSNKRGPSEILVKNEIPNRSFSRPHSRTVCAKMELPTRGPQRTNSAPNLASRVRRGSPRGQFSASKFGSTNDLCDLPATPSLRNTSMIMHDHMSLMDAIVSTSHLGELPLSSPAPDPSLQAQTA